MRSTVLLFFAVAAIAQARSFRPKPAGNLIFAVQGKAPKDEKEWQTVSSRRAVAVSNCTDQLSEACDNCHKVYRDNQK